MRPNKYMTRLDLTDPRVTAWANSLLTKHPEFGGLFLTPPEMEEKYLTPEGKQAARAGRISLIPLLPELPGILPMHKGNMNREEWEIWLWYYSMCQSIGIDITPGTIGVMLNRPESTVNDAFKKAKKRILDFPP